MSSEDDDIRNKDADVSPSKAKRGFLNFRNKDAAAPAADTGFGLPSMPNEIIRKYQRGVEFRGKLIGSDTVASAKGDSMCHTALAKLKAAVLVAKQHKPKLIIKVTDKELRLLDQDTRTDLHIHKLYKISYIVSDPNDRRAFGYIYGDKEGPWTFYGVKTEGAAIAMIMAIKELFEALASKKNEDDDSKSERPKLATDEAATKPEESSEKKAEATSEVAKDAPPSRPPPTITTTPADTTTSSEKKRASVEDMLLAIEDSSTDSPSLKPRSSADFESSLEAPVEQPKSVQDVLSDLFAPMAVAPSGNSLPLSASPFGAPVAPIAGANAFPPAGYFPPSAQFGNPYANFGAYPPQASGFYAQPTYGNVVQGFGFPNPMQPQSPFAANRFPAPMPQPLGFGQTFQSAAGDNTQDSNVFLTPQVAPNAPAAVTQQAPRPAAPITHTGDSWSFAGTGLPPKQDPGLFSEFLPSDLDPNQASKSTGNYVAMGQLANNGNQ